MDVLSELIVQTIPSPAEGVWHLGPIPIRGYALSIILGIVVAIWIGDRRWVARGGQAGQVADLAVWMVPFGLVGGRLYHVITDSHLYFGEGRDPITALYVWRGGLGIWGAIALGAVGLLIGCRVMNIRLLPMMDALAPAWLVGQAIGRWGNWFNQELFGKPTDLPWALKVSDSTAVQAGYPPGTTFHPTFLYEFLWCLAAFALVVWLDRRFTLGHGRVLALTLMAYTAGRFWIENLRIDDVQLSNVGGMRFNAWMSLVIFALALIGFVVSARTRPGREVDVYTSGRTGVAAAGSHEYEGADEKAAEDEETAEKDAEREPAENDAEHLEADGPPAKSSDPDGADRDGTDPDGTDPDGTDPDGTDPDGTNPDGTEVAADPSGAPGDADGPAKPPTGDRRTS